MCLLRVFWSVFNLFLSPVSCFVSSAIFFSFLSDAFASVVPLCQRSCHISVPSSRQWLYSRLVILLLTKCIRISSDCLYRYHWFFFFGVYIRSTLDTYGCRTQSAKYRHARCWIFICQNDLENVRIIHLTSISIRLTMIAFLFYTFSISSISLLSELILEVFASVCTSPNESMDFVEAWHFRNRVSRWRFVFTVWKCDERIRKTGKKYVLLIYFCTKTAK